MIYKPVSCALAEVQRAMPADFVALFQGCQYFRKPFYGWPFILAIPPGISISVQCSIEFVATVLIFFENSPLIYLKFHQLL